jgi:hypothetical protein
VNDLACSQRAICTQYGADFLEAPRNSKVGIAIGTLDGRQPLNALRHRPEGSTSGWYIWAGEEWSNAPDFFVPLHVGHLDRYCPDLLPFLGLGAGWRVLLAPGHTDVWFDSALLPA